MKNTEYITMQLNIGEQRIAVKTPFDRQDFIRETERELDSLYRRWKRDFPTKTDREILAMTAYQYASFYRELTEDYRRAGQLASRCLEEIEEDIADA